MACGMDELRLEGAIKRINGVAFAVDIGGTLAKLAYYAVHKRRALSIRREDNETETTNHDGVCCIYEWHTIFLASLIIIFFYLIGCYICCECSSCSCTCYCYNYYFTVVLLLYSLSNCK